MINVGLPRSGTQSVHCAAGYLGVKSAHIATNEGYDTRDMRNADVLHFKKTGQGPLKTFTLKYEMVGDAPYFSMIKELREYFPHAVLYATTRTKTSWIQSIQKGVGAGGADIRSMLPGVNVKSWKDWTPDLLANLYDLHYGHLRHFKIIPLPLESSSDEKWRIITSIINCHSPGRVSIPNVEWPRIDLGNKREALHMKYSPNGNCCQFQNGSWHF